MPPSPAKASDPVNTDVGDYWMPALAGHDNLLLRSAAPHSSTPYSGMPGFGGQHARVDPDFLQRPLVFFLDVAAEDQVRIGVAMQPAIILDFGFQLSGFPAGVTQRQDGVLRSRALRDRLENIDRRGQANSVVDLQRRILDEEIARMQHEAAAGLDRAAF